MKLCTAVQEGCGYKDTLGAHRYFVPLAKYFTVCITYQPSLVHNPASSEWDKISGILPHCYSYKMAGSVLNNTTERMWKYVYRQDWGTCKEEGIKIYETSVGMDCILHTRKI